MDNEADTVFQYDASGFVLTSWNNNAHLSKKAEETF